MKAFDGFLDSGRKPARELASKSALCARSKILLAQNFGFRLREREKSLCATFREKQSFMYREEVATELKERRAKIQKAEKMLSL